MAFSLDFQSKPKERTASNGGILKRGARLVTYWLWVINYDSLYNKNEKILIIVVRFNLVSTKQRQLMKSMIRSHWNHDKARLNQRNRISQKSQRSLQARRTPVTILARLLAVRPILVCGIYSLLLRRIHWKYNLKIQIRKQSLKSNRNQTWERPVASLTMIKLFSII